MAMALYIGCIRLPYMVKVVRVALDKETVFEARSTSEVVASFIIDEPFWYKVRWDFALSLQR
jgi:hypothetical protein